MIIYRTIAVVILALGLTACAGLWGEKEVPLSEVPAAAVAAAEAKVGGLKIKSAEVEAEDGKTVYELDGKADGVKYEIRVTADGDVVKVKKDQ